ncbi:MAG: transcription elongation factor GreAB [Clostridiaceae bacterium]|nr:transcription elongation factor GreAB [Clostridiaceae bacterium]
MAKKFYIILIILSISLTSCTFRKSVETELYEGKLLTIGIIGEIPTVREKNISFNKLNFVDLHDDLNSKYDAIFITKENLSKAADSEFLAVYKSSNIPFFFIQSTKGYIPFIEEGLSYEDASEFSDGSYITGLYYGKDIHWTFNLYNDIENSKNIEEVYSRVFTIISKIADSTYLQ